MNETVLGIDPGTTVAGYGVVARTGRAAGRLVECGIIRPRPGDLGGRLQEVYEGVVELIDRHRPATVAVESVFYGQNVRSTVVLSHARGVILLAAVQAGVPVVEFSPATVKKTIAGTGRAAKEQIAYMVQQQLRLKSPPEPADAADGVALALTHILQRRLGL